MDQQPPFSLSKRRRASHFSIDDKERILNIFKVCSEQNPKNNKTENVAFTAKAVGISVASVHNVLREYKNGHTLHPPKAYYRKRTIVDNINDETKSKLRRLVHSFFERNEPPTLNKILAAVHEDEEMLHFKRSTLRVLLKEIGFKLATNESLAIPSNSQLVSASANIMTSPKKQINLKSSSESPLISGYHLAKRLKLKDVSSPSRNESSSVSTVVSWTASEAEDEIRRLAVSKQMKNDGNGDDHILSRKRKGAVDVNSIKSEQKLRKSNRINNRIAPIEEIMIKVEPSDEPVEEVFINPEQIKEPGMEIAVKEEPVGESVEEIVIKEEHIDDYPVYSQVYKHIQLQIKSEEDDEEKYQIPGQSS